MDNLSERSEHNRSAQMLIYPGYEGLRQVAFIATNSNFPLYFQGVLRAGCWALWGAGHSSGVGGCMRSAAVQ